MRDSSHSADKPLQLPPGQPAPHQTQPSPSAMDNPGFAARIPHSAGNQPSTAWHSPTQTLEEAAATLPPEIASGFAAVLANLNGTRVGSSLLHSSPGVISYHNTQDCNLLQSTRGSCTNGTVGSASRMPAIFESQVRSSSGGLCTCRVQSRRARNGSWPVLSTLTGSQR